MTENGFSLIELIVAIAIMGIVMAVAMPGLRTFFLNNEQVRSMNEFTGFVNYVRAEALRRGTPVTICRSQNGVACGGNWEDGWLIFQDINGDGNVNAADTQLKIGGPLNPDPAQKSLTMRGNNNVANRITMTTRGFTNNNGTIRFCDGRGVRDAKALVISRSGRVRRAIDQNGNGIVEDGGQVDIVCP